MTLPTLVFSLPGHEALGKGIATALDVPEGALTVREFPDGETYVRGETPCDGRDVVLAANLFQPNAAMLPLMFCAQAMRVVGARRIILVSPYLPYMRQDARFQPGEVITSRIFAKLLSQTVDGLVTVDPHLHRYTALSEIYSIPSRTEHAAPAIAEWIRSHVDRPLIIGPDSESEQWVEQVSNLAHAPHIVLSKKRRGDRDVVVEVPSLDAWRGCTPVLVDDIISTARTMIETIGHLTRAGYSAPICVGVHGVFAGDAYEELQRAGAAKVVTCNTVPHSSNAIDLTPALTQGICHLLKPTVPSQGTKESTS